MSVFDSLTREGGAYAESVYLMLLDLVDYSSIPKGKLSALCAGGRSPMAICALSGFSSCVEKMLKNGVSADDCHENGEFRTALHSMILLMSEENPIRNPDGFVKCFNLILSKADLNHITIIEDEGRRKRYKTPLVVALEARLFPVATRLINEGADVNARLYGCVNTLGLFLREKAINDIVEYLVQAGAHVENDPEAKELLKKYEKAWYWYQKKHL